MWYVPDDPALAHVGGNQIGGNAQTFYPELWAWLVKEYGVKTVLDVGCGEGHALREFRKLGCLAIGCDGAPRNVAIARVGDYVAHCHDLTCKPFCVYAPLPDLVWCCEVVGQIEERYVANVVQTLAQGRAIAMTNELPGQNCYHGVNLKPVRYWQNKLSDVGYELDAHATLRSQEFGHDFWLTTGRIYRRVIP